MDPILLDFAMGIGIGSISELLFLRRSDRKKSLKKPVPGTRPKNDLRSLTRSTKTLKVSRATIARPLSEPNSRVETESNGVQRSVVYSEPPQISCPACGLRAPEKLMAEHLLGSPLHRKQAPAPLVPRIPPATPSARTISLQEEDSRESMRNLLQMLVPPRAFGRRHGQRTPNPLVQLVQTPD